MSHPLLRRLSLVAALGLAALSAPAGATAGPSGIEHMNQAEYQCGLTFEPRAATGISTASGGWNDMLIGKQWPRGAGVGTNLSQFAERFKERGASKVTVTPTVKWRSVSPTGVTVTETAAAPPSTFSLETPTIFYYGEVPAPQLLIDEEGSWSLYFEGISFDVSGTNGAGETVDLDPIYSTDGTADISCGGPSFLAAYGRAIVDRTPNRPTIARVENVGTTTATLVLEEPTGHVPTSYMVSSDGLVIGSYGPGQRIALTGLKPSTTYNAYVYAFVGPLVSPASETFTFTTEPNTSSVDLTAKGSLSLRSPVSGSTTVVGALSGSRNNKTRGFIGNATFRPTTATFKAYGVFPVRATLEFTPVGAATGIDNADGFTVSTTQDIKITSASFVGVRVATGACHTAVPPAISLKRVGAGDLLTGGSASAVFTLGRLTGCSTLGSLVGTNGGSSVLAVKLAPAAVATN